MTDDDDVSPGKRTLVPPDDGFAGAFADADRRAAELVDLLARDAGADRIAAAADALDCALALLRAAVSAGGDGGESEMTALLGLIAHAEPLLVRARRRLDR